MLIAEIGIDGSYPTSGESAPYVFNIKLQTNDTTTIEISVMKLEMPNFSAGENAFQSNLKLDGVSLNVLVFATR